MSPAHLAITANTLSGAGGGIWVNALVRGIITAPLLVLLVHHGFARAEEMGTRGTLDYCSMIGSNVMIFGLSQESDCAVGTGHLFGIIQDKLVLDRMFGLEVLLGLGDKEVSIQREQVNKPISMKLKFNRHNVFLGFIFKW